MQDYRSLSPEYVSIDYRPQASGNPETLNSGRTMLIDVVSSQAEKGDPVAQYNLGALYTRGLGVKQDDGQAAQWFEKAADQGDAFAQYNLGDMYATGQGVQKDYAQAYFWKVLALNPKDPDHDKKFWELARHLSAEEIAEANARAAEWKRSHQTVQAAKHKD